jgi:hypothetical protein
MIAKASWQIIRPSNSARLRRLGVIAMLAGSIMGCGEDPNWQRTYRVEPHQTQHFTYRTAKGQVFSFAVLDGPAIPEEQVGLKFGWDKQRLFCTGKDCAHASGWLLFCPVHGSITGEMNNLSDSEFQVQVQRVRCEDPGAGPGRCPTPSLLQAMCGSQ